jgi:Susd and RagB outer membrane lipoprotein
MNIVSKNNVALALAFIVTLSSCTKDYGKINTNKDAIGSVGRSELPYLFSKAVTAIQWNDQTGQNLYADQYAQYFANETTYFPTDRYEMDMSWLHDPWSSQYTQVVPQLQTLFDNYEENTPEYQLASIWWVYSFSRITDYWGPIPYFKAGEPLSSVPYDAQKDIYDDFFSRLNKAVEILNAQKNSVAYGGSYDIIYAGNVSKWIKFANTLRLRLAMRISNIDPARAKNEGETAYKAGVMEATSDDALVKRNLIDRNQLSIFSTYGQEFCMSAAMESALKGYKDPRIKEYFLPALESGTYEGIRNGLSINEIDGMPENSIKRTSHIGPRWATPAQGGIADFLSTPCIAMTSAEAYFLRAEGVLLKWDMGGTATDLYEKGISTSMNQWGITDIALINNYINSVNTPIPTNDFLNTPRLADVPVKFDAANQATQLKQVAIQKWLALYPDGWEAWADYRRRPVINLYPVVHSDNPEIPDPTKEYIRRVPFLLSEKETNGTEVQKATTLLGGPDKITTRLWWDVN